MISISGLDYHFDSRQVLKSLHLNVPEGIIHSLIGTTGAGKTLTLKLIAGLMPIQTGKVATTSNDISFVFQQNSFLPWLTMQENLKCSLGEFSKEFNQALAQLNLSLFLESHPKELSGGTLQKFALVRAFAKKSKIILLDEPFSHLDIVQKEDLYKTLILLWQGYRPTLLIVSHDIDEVLLLSHSISFLSLKSKHISNSFDIRPYEEIPQVTLAKSRQDNGNYQLFEKLLGLLKEDLT